MIKRFIKFCVVVQTFLTVLFVFSGYTAKENKTNEKLNVKEIELVDSVGRKVKIKSPVNSAVVVDRYNNEMIRAIGAIHKVSAVDMNTAQDREYWKQFDPKNVIGDDLSDYNYEKIIEENPDIFIVSDISPYKEAEEKLAPFDIPVFAVKTYIPSEFEENARNIGKIFGSEDGAENLIRYFKSKIDYINNHVKDIDKKSVYFETTTNLKAALPGSGYNQIIEYAKGKNIFSEDYKNISNTEVDSEEIVKRNPDVIVKLITAPSLAGAGVYTPLPKEYVQKIYQEMIARPGWENLDAVKNGQVYFMSQFGQGGAGKLVGTIYLAKWLYPQQLKELNPDIVFKDWMEKFQGFKDIKGHFYTAQDLNKNE